MMDGFFIDPDVVRETGSRMPGPAMGTVMEDCKAESDGLVTAKVEYELGEKGKKTRKALVALEYTADKGGIWFLPEVGARVLVEFLNGDPDLPVITRCFASPDMKLPEGLPGEKNQKKGFQTRNGVGLWIQDEDKKQKVTLNVGGELTVSVDAEKKTISVGDAKGDNQLDIDTGQGMIRINAAKKIELAIGGTAALTIEKNKLTISSGTVSIEAGQSLKLKGQTAWIQGSQIQAKADASMKLESGAMLEVKGAMVKLN